MSQDITTKLKIWLFPSLVTILGTLIWRDLSEMKSDIKELLAQSNIDKTRIDNLERILYNNKTSAFLMSPSTDDNQEDRKQILYASKELAINENKKKKLHVKLKRVVS